MSTRLSASTAVPVQNRRAGGLGTPVLMGLMPLLALLVVVSATLLAVALVRQLTAAAGFFTQQQVSLIFLICGLALAALVYIVALTRTCRRIATWQARGDRRARAALLALLATALIVALPVVLAIVLPQSPAP
ncbi:MAG TPA: hypothetical protein VKR83_10825 [Ktedonobacteraceae bacterium]|nr:hypothetical protein [Ktedonobacteraceae bacterium]